ncbi:MAG: hypothetical protein H0X25_19480 [Acidobacteriales bacterium]|nr:hypothetical protein [Terriglobales bacterium]
MKKSLKILLGTAILPLAILPLFAQQKTFTGEVSDATCGTKHTMAGNPAKCTRACVGKGSAYALIADNKVYTLQSQTPKVTEKLAKMAGMQAKVTGNLSGDTVQVSSVSKP